MKSMKFYSVLLVATLGFNAYFPVGLRAEELMHPVSIQKTISEACITARQADLETLFKTLESNHPNIYHKNNQAIFKQKITEIERALHTMSDFEFAIALSELTALVGDSHTKLSIGGQLGKNAHYIPIDGKMIKEGLLITGIPSEHQQALGGILTSINGMSLEEIKQKIMPMLCFDNEVYLNKQFVGTFYVYDILEHYGVLNSPKKIVLEIKLGEKLETIEVEAIDKKGLQSISMSQIPCEIPETAMDASKLYFFKPLDEETLYIQYNACREDEHLPMEKFARQVNDAITQKGYKRTILDLRYNSGGSDGVIIPLMYVLDEKNQQDGMQLYTLIGSNTFSSALINAVEFKEIGSVLVGSPTGGSVDHFGQVSSFELPNSKIKCSYSNKFCDLGLLIDAAKDYEVEPLLPDLWAEQTREDYLMGQDTAIQAILADKENKVAPKIELTRGALAVYLGRDYMERTGSTMNSVTTSFEDISMFSYDTPYVVWASTHQIINGESEALFVPNQALTRAQIAVILQRYAQFMGISLEDLIKKDIEIVDMNEVEAWEEDAVRMLGGTELFPLIDGKFEPKEIVSRQAFDALFKVFKKYMD
ncbi:MAG: S-layer homology domain-containing protein [Cellulosilyticum sp.]|nr:S-layer homology domain-containing protein [Cellulosilyticum sp.]